ncbi:MAG TPA: M13 family metallopeptidase [Bacteroidales bacterium]|nr:M13 family metallopeptidase [Bacteroidales bacterium]
MKRLCRLKVALLVTAILFMVACKPRDNNAVIPIDRSNMDFSVNPGDDFFRFVNGGWLVANPIPDEYSRYGAFEQLRKANDQQLQALIEQISADQDAQPGSNRQKIRDFFNSAIDTVSIEEQGLTPLLPKIQRINNLTNSDELASTLAFFHLHGIRPLFSIFASQDRKNAEMNIANLAQGGLGMTDRDYYFLNDPRSIEIRTAYETMIETIFGLAGYDENKAAAARKTIMAIETRLAKASMDRVTRRDPHATYHKKPITQLTQIAPSFNWKLYFDELGITIEELNVSQPKFFSEVDKLLQEYNLDAWKTYLTWNLLRTSAPFLSSDFEKASFEFYGRVMTGRIAEQERWRRALSWLNSAMGEAVGQEYVAVHFPPEAKERMIDLVEHLRKAFSKQIDQLTWMSDTTKAQSQKKLASMNVKIGYPDKWIDYSTMNISIQPFVINMFEGNRFNTRRNLDRIGRPVDRDEWFMSPQTVNAYYSASLNEIVFPAGILQPPFFYLDGDDAVNFGAIGMVIGHEIIHGFDDQGRKFDAEGNLRDWWTPEDAQNFKKLSQVLVDQFNNYVMLDTLTINGQLSLGENIADLGGLTIAFNGLQSKLAETGRPDLIDGFTPEQRFFISYAQIWRNNVRDQELRRQINEGPHSPGEARVNGPVYNMESFYQAFDIQPGTARFIKPEHRAQIW